MPVTVVILDHAAEVAAWLASGANASAETVIVATRPQAYLALEKAGVPHQRIEVFFDHFSLRDLETGKYASLWPCCQRADDMLAAAHPDFGRHFRPITGHFVFLNLLVDNIVMRLEHLAAIRKATSCHEIVTFPGEAPADSDLLFAPDTNIYGLILPAFATATGIRARLLPPCRSTTAAAPATVSKLRHLLYRLMRSGSLRRLTGHGLRRLRRHLKTAPRLEAGSIVYTQSLIDPLETAGAVNSIFWPAAQGPLLDAATHVPLFPETSTIPTDAIAPATIDHLLADPIVQAGFRHGGVDYLPIIRHCLVRLVSDFVPQQYARYQHAGSALAAVRARAVVCTNMSTATQHAAVQAAHNLDIPVIGTHHGQLGDQMDLVWSYYELPHCTNYLVYTPLAARHIQEHQRFSGTLHVTGSAYLDTVRGMTFSRAALRWRHRIPQHRRLVVFVTVPPFGNCMRLGQTEADGRMFEKQKRIVDAILSCEGIHLVVKGLRSDTPAQAPLMQYVKSLDHPQVQYVTDTSFAEFLDAADLFVVDHPGLTLMEALTRQTQIYICNDQYRWIEPAPTMLRHDTVFEPAIDAFCDRLTADIHSGAAFSPRRGKNGFYTAFIDSFGDGQSVRRTRETVLDIAGIETPDTAASPVERIQVSQQIIIEQAPRR